MEERAKVWAFEGDGLWQPGSVTKKTAKNEGGFDIEVALDIGGKKIYTVSDSAEEDSNHLKLRNVAGQATVVEGANVADLTSLTYLHEPSILYSLKERYGKNAIYTYTGPILLAVNPFQHVDLYTDRLLAAYKVDGEGRAYDPNFVETKPPHVYAIADKAYRNMTTPTTEYGLRSQSILVSGESGAGKTETCKIIMKYLAILGNATGDASKLGAIENRVLQSNPILEAFGNARTVRNDNSSRFGKYIQLLFNERGKLAGAAIKEYETKAIAVLEDTKWPEYMRAETFLLEKIRVVKQSSLERNYHIFYIVNAGATSKERERWHLLPCSDYYYTNQSGCYDRRDGVKDIDLYKGLQEAFTTMGFDAKARDDCLSCVATILALGNLEFEQISGAREDEKQARLDSGCQEAAYAAAKLLGVSPDALAHCLTARKVRAGNTNVTIYLTHEQAAHARDAMSKALYAATFSWVVSYTNKSIGEWGGSDSTSGSEAGGGGDAGIISSNSTTFNTKNKFIGLLDIFGFEVFAENFFEQFLINYANEVLQQQFNNFVFRQEQEEYRHEQLNWTFISFPDNGECITLIEKKPNGIIPTLDEQCLIGRSTDDRFARELYKKSEGNSSFFLQPKMRADHAFGIKHYAGDVIYDTDGMIEKNRDTLPQEGVDLLMSSTNPFTVLLGNIEANKTTTSSGASSPKGSSPKDSRSRSPEARGGGGARGQRSTIGAKSLGTQFKENLNNLLSVVNLTHPHYVRCIKPNDQLVPSKFNHTRIAEQLRNAGVLEVVRVARAGFPVRLGLREFVERYALLGGGVVEVASRRASHEEKLDQERSICKALIIAIQGKLKLQSSSSSSKASFEEMCQKQGMQMGLTKVFFQQKSFNSIEKLRTSIVADAAITVQTFWRGISCRRAYLIRKGLISKSDGSRRERGLAACRIQRLARRYIWATTKSRREAKARAQREAQLEAQMEELRMKMQGEINALRAELAEVNLLAKQGQCLANRIVFVCGGGAVGIGPGVASRLVAEGAKVVIVGVNASSAKGKIKGLDGGVAGDDVAGFVDADLSTEDSVKRAFQEASKCFKGVNAMVHITQPLKTTRDNTNAGLSDFNILGYQAMLASELQTPLLCAKQATSFMTNMLGGSIVFVVESGDPRSSPVVAGNVGIVSALTVSAAAAGAVDGVRVNCVSHAVGGGSSGSGGEGHSVVFPLAVSREPNEEDVAVQVAHLLSDKTAFVTGQTISADSGRSVM